MDISPLLKKIKFELFPIQHADSLEDYAKVDLNETNLTKYNIDASDSAELKEYLNKQKDFSKAKVMYGGYLEKRNLYSKSILFNSAEIRNIHLGVDFWAAKGTGVIAPLGGTVHVVHFNSGKGNYGGTIVLKHQIEGVSFYSLYGHLSKASLGLAKGETIKKGELIGHLGDETENGGYVPHLHFQWIIDFPVDANDYPGVCSIQKLAYFSKNSPKPKLTLS